MKDYFINVVVPFVCVSLAIAILTLAIFDVAEEPRVSKNRVQLTPSNVDLSPSPANPIPEMGDVPSGTLRPREKQMRAMSDVFREAARNLDKGRKTTASVPKTAGAASPAKPTGEQESVISAVGHLGEAIQAARDARNEQDLVRAEEQLREARKKMEASCKGGGGPLCQSAERMKGLGY